MLRQLETALLAVGIAAMAGGATRPATVGGSCAPRDAQSDRLVANFKAFVGKTDMGGTIERTTMHLQDVTPAQVALVTDNATCAKAAAAFDRKTIPELKRSTYALYVVRLGSSFGVEDTKSLQPGFETAYVFDRDWNFIGVRQIHS